MALLSIFTVLSSIAFSTGGEDENSPNYNFFHRHISFEKVISPEGDLLIFINWEISKSINEKFLKSYLFQKWDPNNREINLDKIDFYINILKGMFSEYGRFIEGRINISRAEGKRVELNIDKSKFLTSLTVYWK